MTNRSRALKIVAYLGIATITYGQSSKTYFRLTGCEEALMSDAQIRQAIPEDARINVMLGVPKRTHGFDDLLIARRQFVLGYDSALSVSRWVAWYLGDDWMGKTGRTRNTFVSEPALLGGYYRVKQGDYTGSHYDRGHLCPSEQRSDNVTDNANTFILSNVLPQRPDLNRGVWRDMERWCVSMVKDSAKDLFILAGGIFRTNQMMNRHIAIPDSCFKIVVVLNKEQTLSDVTRNTRVEAVIMPNMDGVLHEKWRSYKRTLKEVEASTGYIFLSNLSPAIRRAIENE